MKGVFIDGSWVEEPTRVKEEVRMFFQQRFQESKQCRPELNGIRFNSIAQQQNDVLVRHFDEEEMKKCETDFYWSEKLVRVSYYRGIYRPFNCWTNNNRF